MIERVRAFGIGWILALLVLIADFVLVLMGRIDGLEAAMLGGLALAILLG